jgi:hypothetical protein
VVPIDNRLGNQVQALMRLELALMPGQTEYIEWYFHKGGPSLIEEYDIWDTDPYPTVPDQTYNSANDGCPTGDASQTITPSKDEGVTPNAYSLVANSVQCDGVTLNHPAISETTLAALVNKLTSLLPQLGTWAVAQNGTDITLTDS